jgi:hypothetical protein
MQAPGRHYSTWMRIRKEAGSTSDAAGTSAAEPEDYRLRAPLRPTGPQPEGWHLHVYRSRTQLRGIFPYLDEVDHRIDRSARRCSWRARGVRRGAMKIRPPGTG